MVIPREIYKKTLNGDSLSDEEIYDGIIFFRHLAEDLGELGAVFHLPHSEARRVHDVLDEYRRARLR